ncbi:MAG: hypothetical protein HOH43_24810 [Candidatus Latescibacteria bacterium]|nr:hypothetical protein [Candidatus Latescibacterota bacterium]
MTFHDYLKELPLDDLKLMGETLDVKSSMISRARLLRELPIQMLQPGFIASLTASLSARDRELLVAVMIAGEHGYSCDATTSTDGQLAERLFSLLSKGLIVGRWGYLRSPEYVIPSDISEILERQFRTEILGQLETDTKVDSGMDTGSLAFIRDIFSFLSWLRAEPVRLKDKDVIYKRSLDQLYERLESKDRRSSSSMSPYPDRLDLMIQYCRTRQLIYEDDSRLKCSTAFEQWLHLPTDEKLDDLLAYWYTKRQNGSQRAAILLNILNRSVDVGAINQNRLTDLVIACMPDVTNDAAVLTHNRLSIEEALCELEWLGVVRRVGVQENAPAALAVSYPGRSVLGNHTWGEEGMWVEAFLVQPTFEVIVPHTVQLVIRDELERFADLLSADVTLTYRITRDTVYRAGDAGMSGEAIIAFLERHSHKEIPQNVEYSVREWGENYGQVYFMDVFLLRTTEPELARHIKAHSQLAPYVLGEVAPDALIVERHRYREMMEVLRNLGFMPKSQVVGADLELSLERHHFTREYFADVWARHSAHRPAASVVGIDETLPGFRLTRRLHTKDDDSRHLEASTIMQNLSSKQTQELLEMAIRQEKTVLVEYFTGNRSNSKLQKIRPDHIDRSRGTPHVEAYSHWEERARSFKIANIKGIRVTDGEDT